MRIDPLPATSSSTKSAGRPMAQRLTLVQRQQKLLEERGFSKPKGDSNFAARQDAHLEKTGRANAVGSSRRKVEAPMIDAMEGFDDAKSMASRASHAPSLHPSMAGTVISQACHSETIGAGDETMYWDFQHRLVERGDLG